MAHGDAFLDIGTTLLQSQELRPRGPIDVRGLEGLLARSGVNKKEITTVLKQLTGDCGDNGMPPSAGSSGDKDGTPVKTEIVAELPCVSVDGRIAALRRQLLLLEAGI